MKALILFFFIAMTSTPQVVSPSGVYEKIQGQNLVKLGWGTSLNSTQPYYNTIRRGNGTIVVDGYYHPNNVIMFEVENGYSSETFSITQTYEGVESAPAYALVVNRTKKK